MIPDHDDEQFNEWLRDAARAYHAPGPTPREEMWARIEEQRAKPRVVALRPWFRWGLGIAAVLALGVAIGRFTAPGRPGPDAAGDGLAYRIAATHYLSRAETFLTEFRADVRQGTLDARFAGQAEDLLTTTRLMLDSPAGRDQRLRALLEELELTLVQIAQLALRPADRDEIDLITQGMEQRGVLTRLRSAIPAGPSVALTQGAL